MQSEINTIYEEMVKVVNLLPEGSDYEKYY